MLHHTMDSSVGPSSTVVLMLTELLTAEKEDTRVWMRAEMDRFVDPILDSIFNRLQTKLINGLERTQSGDDCGQLTNLIQHEPPIDNVDQLSVFKAHSSSHLNQHIITNYNSQQSPNIPSDQFSTHLSSSSFPVSSVSTAVQSITQITLPNQLINIESCPIKHEIESITAVQPSTLFHLNPTVHYSNEQSNNNSNDQNWDEGEDDEDCDCDDCVNGIEIKEEGDDDGTIELIDVDQELPRPVKKPRMDSTQPNNAQPEATRHRQQTDEPQPNQANKQIITVHLQCPECCDTFPENQLPQHMFDKHSMGPSQCIVMDCTQTFDNSAILREHLKQAHQHISQWLCSKCSNKQFTSYITLSDHNFQHHQLGLFQCSVPECTFTGECRRKVYTHYKCKHRDKPEFVCHQSGCGYRTKDSTRFKAHERAHLGIKPYRCKWPLCDYSNASQNTTMMHIKAAHFNPTTSSSEETLSGKPKDYLDVVHELL